MLILSRKPEQIIVIGDNIQVVVVSVNRFQVTLGIEAPPEVKVYRDEIYQRILRQTKNISEFDC